MKKHLIVGSVATVALAGGTLLVATPAFAQSHQPSHQTLLERMARAFGKSEAEVEAVFEEVHQERMAERAELLEEKLNQLVADGEISPEQKNLIIAKHQEMVNQRQQDRAAWQTMTPSERREQRYARRAALQEWVEDQGIDPSVMIGLGKEEFQGRGRGMR